MEALPPERVLHIRFEELIQDSVNQFASIAAFCEIENPDQLIALTQEQIDPNRPHYSPPLTGDDWAEILPIIGPLQKRLGYECHRS